MKRGLNWPLQIKLLPQVDVISGRPMFVAITAVPRTGPVCVRARAPTRSACRHAKQGEVSAALGSWQKSPSTTQMSLAAEQADSSSWESAAVHHAQRAGCTALESQSLGGTAGRRLRSCALDTFALTIIDLKEPDSFTAAQLQPRSSLFLQLFLFLHCHESHPKANL